MAASLHLAALPARLLLRCLYHWARLRGKGGWYGSGYYRYSGLGPSPMGPDRAGQPVGPPDEAYGRVTNPERFLPLHSSILELMDRMEQTFDVHRTEGFGLDEELEGKRGTARPSILLTPADINGAPITVTFSDFPGLYIRFGRWVTEPFPSCGCDACDESAEEEFERLTELVDIVTAGGFQEAVRCPRGPFARDGWRKYEFRSPTHRSSGESRISRSRSLQMTGGARHVRLDWQPWPRRQ